MRKILIAFITILLFLGSLALRPINHQRTLTITGVVKSVKTKGGEGDIQLRLYQDKHIYHMNRAMDKGIDIHDLSEQILNQTIELHYAKHWTPLDPRGKIRPVSVIRCNGKEVFSYR